MKKLYNELITTIEYKHFSIFSFILLIIWAISPIIEYLFKNYFYPGYTHFFVFAIYLIGILGILEYIVYLCKRIKDKTINSKELTPQILIFILIVLSFIASIFSNNSYLSFFGDSYRKEGFFVYVMYVGFVLSASLIKDKKYIEHIIKIIIASALFITIMPLFEDSFSYTNFANIYHNINHYGYFLMISAMLSGFMFLNTTHYKKIIYWLIYIFLIHMLIRNNTFGCFVAMALSLIFALIYSLITKYKRISVTVLLITFILTSFLISHYDIKIGERMLTNNKPGIVTKNLDGLSKDLRILVNNESTIDSIGTGRWFLWKEAINYILKRPISGGGMECLKEYYKNLNNHNDRPHNMILQVAAFIGIPGAIVYMYLILYLAFTNLKNIKNNPINYVIYITAMCYFISSLFGNSMYYTSPYFAILLGILIGIRNKEPLKN